MKNTSLPDRSQALDMVLALESPFQVIAWIMLETGVKFHDLQGMRVQDVQAERGVLTLGRRLHRMSEGLRETLEIYLRDVLRPAYEQLKRRREARPFASVKLFPAWILDGYEHLPVASAFPLDEYLAALRCAAAPAGFRGLVNSNTLRLVAAREWLKQGMSVTELHQRLGHGDLMTTMLLAQTLQYGEITFAAAA